MKRFSQLTQTASEADLVAGNFLAIDVPGVGGATKKMPGNMLPACKVIDRGSATVATINALTFKQAGWLYYVSDDGTLTDGSIDVEMGDLVIWDAVNTAWKIIKGYYSKTNATPDSVLTIKRDEIFDGFVNPNTGVVELRANRYRTRYLYITAPTISVSCPGYQYRVTFYSTNRVPNASYVINLNDDENKNWQNGNLNELIKVPSGGLIAVLSFRKGDDSAMASDEEIVVNICGYNDYGATFATIEKVGSQCIIESSATNCVYKALYVNDSEPVPECIKVVVPSDVSFRLHGLRNKNLLGDYDYTTNWFEGSGVVRTVLSRVAYLVEFKKRDGSAMSFSDLVNVKCEFLADNIPLGLRVSILGDSLSTFGGSVSDPDNARYAVAGDPTYPGNRCRYPQSNLLTQEVQTYWRRVVDHFGMKFGISESWAGSRVSNTSATDSGDLGPNRCISSQTRINHLAVNGTPDVIIVNGGTNDAGANVTIGTFNYENPKNYTDAQIAALDVTTFAGAYRAMLIRLQKTYPNARIICMLPNYTTSYYDAQKQDAYCELIKEACDYFGVQYFDSRNIGINLFSTGDFLPDGIHYNANGMLFLAQALFKAIENICLKKLY